MNEKTITFIIIALIALAGAAYAVFNIPDRTSDLTNIAVSDESERAPTQIRVSEPAGGNDETESLIVYHCNDGDFEICAIRTDGTGFRKLTNNSNDDVNPAINHTGMIAYICTRNDEHMTANHPEICVVDTDGRNLRQVTDNEALPLVSRFEDLVINDRGQIFYICKTETGIEICRVHASGGRAPMLVSDNELWESNLAMNSQGNLVFLCFPEGTQFTETIEICSMFEDGAGYTVYHAHENYENGPVINDSGYIVSNCEREGRNEPGLCVIDVLYSDRLHLFDVPEARESGALESFVVGQRYALNNMGQIVYQCAFTDATQESELCLINVDGTGFRQLTDNQIDDEAPAINDDGVVAYLCGTHLCVINSDGTNQRQLTDQLILAPGAFAKLKMN